MGKYHAPRTAVLAFCVAAVCAGLIGCEKPAPPATPASSDTQPAPDSPPTGSVTKPAEDPASLTVNIDIGAGPKKIVLEAEAGKIVAPMQTYEDKRASGGKYVMTPEPPDNDHQTLGGETRLIIDVPEAGTYNLWVRVWWNHSCDNSFDVSLAGGEKIQVTNNTYEHWQWLQVARKSFDLPKGRLPVVISSREDESKLDQVLLVETKDDPRLDYVPTGVETAE